MGAIFGGHLGQPPNDGKQYARQGDAWVEVEAGGESSGNIDGGTPSSTYTVNIDGGTP